MAWIFALGIIWFCIVHEGFRKLVFWLGGIAAFVVVISICINGVH